MKIIDKIKDIYYTIYVKRYRKNLKKNSKILSKRVLPEEAKKIMIKKREELHLMEKEVQYTDLDGNDDTKDWQIFYVIRK